MLSYTKIWTLILVLFCLTASLASGATIYVDPVGGNDVTGNGTFVMPYKTLTHAYNVAVEFDAIILFPGVYGPNPGQSGDFWPLYISDKDVVIQGTSALNTVFDGSGSFAILAFYPNTMDEHLEFFLLDSVTLMNADVGILMQSEGHTTWANFANCFIVNNMYGVHMHTVYDFSGSFKDNDWDGNQYVEHRPRFINNTIANNEIGILDDSTILQDPDGTINGEADPAIINCIIYQNALADLEGVDGWDVRNVAFATWDTAGLSQIRFSRPPPIPTVNLLGFPLAGLYLNPSNPNGTGPNDIDYRQFPSAPTIDMGTYNLSPMPNLTVPQRYFAVNGKLTADIWDTDCEGFGNEYPMSDYPLDIGADQLGTYIVMGYDSQTTNLTQGRLFQFRYTKHPSASGLSAVHLFGNFIPQVGWIAGHGYVPWVISTIPGAQSQGTTLNYLPGYGNVYLGIFSPGFPIVLPVTGTPPVYTPLTSAVPATATPLRLNLQHVPFDNVSGQFGPLSNLQTLNFVP